MQVEPFGDQAPPSLIEPGAKYRPPIVDGGACPLSHEPSGIFTLAGVASGDMAQHSPYSSRCVCVAVRVTIF